MRESIVASSPQGYSTHRTALTTFCAPSLLKAVHSMTHLRITLITGTNRTQSNTQRLTRRLAADYRAHTARLRAHGVQLEVRLLDLQTLPSALFHPDSYARPPDELRAANAQVLDADGLVIVTPEYNGGYPGALKLFIDHLPFPQAFEERPVAFVGLGSGIFGGLRAVEQLSQVFAYRNAHIFNRRVLLPQVERVLDDQGQINNPLIEQLLREQTVHFLSYCLGLRALPLPPEAL